MSGARRAAAAALMLACGAGAARAEDAAAPAWSGTSMDEARAIAEEMLSDAQWRSSFLEDVGPPLLRFWGFTQVRYNFNHRDETPDGGEDDTEGFNVARTRLFFDANPREGWSTRIRTSFSRSTGEASLDQAYATVNVGDGFKVRFGQFGLPLFRDEWISAEKQLAVNSSVVNTLFNQGQVQGVWLSREWDSVRFWTAFTDGVRSANTEFDSPKESDVALTGRFEWMIAGDSWARFDDYTSFPGSDFATMLGLAGHWEDGSRQVNGGSSFDLFYFTGDIGIEGDGWNLFGAGVVTSSDNSGNGWITDAGFIVQGGVFVSERTELFARFDMVLPGDRPGMDHDFRTVTAGFNYYVFPGSHALKITANGIWFMDPQEGSPVLPDTNVDLLASPSDGQWGLQVQVQVIF